MWESSVIDHFYWELFKKKIEKKINKDLYSHSSKTIFLGVIPADAINTLWLVKS